MRRLLILPLLTGCAFQNLLWPGDAPPEKKCFWSAYSTRSVTVTSGDSTWTVRDTIWLGTQEIPCPNDP